LEEAMKLLGFNLWIQGDNLEVINLGNRIVNTYLTKIKNGYLLIDTGYSEQFPGFYKKITANNIDLQEISYVFLTHAHDDHAGFLNDILASTNAKIILHKNALEGLHKGQNSFAGGCSGKLALVFCKAMSLFGKGQHKFPSLKEQFVDRCIVVDDNNNWTILNQL
jgi:glyoxylase-like metal-dependent hydrolase (beta-lactamase superfamily II)